MTHELTDKVLAELERLHREATPGEWYVKRRYSNDCEIVPRITCKPDDDRGCGWIADIIGAPYLGHKTTLPNAYLIVAMRNVLPALIAAARRLREVEADREACLAADKMIFTLSQQLTAERAKVRQLEAELKLMKGLESDWGKLQRLNDHNPQLGGNSEGI